MKNIEKLSFNFRAIVEELTKRGIACRFVPTTDILEASFQDHIEILLPGHNRLVPTNYDHLIHDKYYLKMFLEDKGFPIQQGSVFHKDMQQAALDYVKSALNYPVVIKSPAHANGEQVFVNIHDEQEFIQVWQKGVSQSETPYFLVERYFDPSEDYRFFVMDGVDIAVAKRTPPSIVGDGIKTIGELIKIENHRRLHPRETCVGGIYMDDFEGERILTQQSLTMDSVLTAGKQVLLRYNSNIHYGALCDVVTESVHPSYIDVARSLFKLFPGLGYLFIDLFSKDISQPAKPGMYAINEMTTTLSISMFSKPYQGKAVNILTPILDRLFPETAILNKRKRRLLFF